MVWPLAYKDIDSKIKERILPISPSHPNPCLRTELWNQIIKTHMLGLKN